MSNHEPTLIHPGSFAPALVVIAAIVLCGVTLLIGGAF
jgi:hypothetical protein